MSLVHDSAAPPAAVRFVPRLDSPEALRAAWTSRGLLRLSTAGGVDDGKSTLIGRLLFDSHAILEDQLLALDAASRRRGEERNLALLTDGLRAEREQNITIDVAYRYFATPRRKFVIADTPGHAQYTRNMVTGASHAELALILLDVRHGLLSQSRRHAFIASLLGISHFLIAVNKMDLADYAEAAFDRVAAECNDYFRKLDVKDVVFIPVSALHGDNVAARSPRMPWYQGPTLLHHLETVNLDVGRNLLDFRFPVQCVLRIPRGRAFAGQVASGAIRAGDEVLLLPSRRATRVQSIEQAGETLSEASAGEPAVLTLADECDLSRGDMIVRRHNLPCVATRFEAMLCWFSESPLDPASSLILLQASRATRAFVECIEYRLEVDTLHRQPAATLAQNDIGRVRIAAAQPVFFDPFRRVPATGSFILVNPFTHATVAVGVIRGECRNLEIPPPASRPVWEPWNISRQEREARATHRAAVLWFTGLSGSGKSTLARALERRLFDLGCRTMLLDGDQLRHGLCADLGFSAADRAENIRRAGEAAALFFESGALVLCAFVSPFRKDRELVRRRIGTRFCEIFVDCDLAECRRRDPKGLYAAAGAGAIPDLTGVGQPYEAPSAPDFIADTRHRAPAALVEDLLRLLRGCGWLSPRVP